MATQHVTKMERQKANSPEVDVTSRRVAVKSIPSTFARAAFPLGGIGTGTVSLGARGELRDWELANSPAKGRQNANSFFAIHARPKGGVAVNRVLEARIGGDPRRDQQGGFQVYELAGLPRLASARLIGEYPIARVEFEDPELPVRVALTAFTPFVPLDADASGIPATVLRYSVTNPGDVPVSVTIAGSLSHIAGEQKNFRDLVRAWYVGGARQTVSWRDDGEFRGLDFGVDLDPGDKEYGTMSLMTSWGPGRSCSGATSRRTGSWTRPTRPSRSKR
jgi:non-lysosomal glucosylceramidase